MTSAGLTPHRLRSRLGRSASALIDYRIYDPDNDGKTKLEHAQDMLINAVHHKQLSFQSVLMDTWYATKKIMLLIESLNKQYYCPLKNNRQVDDSVNLQSYQRVDSLEWSNEELDQGKAIKIKGFPKQHKVKLFRVAVSYPPHGIMSLLTT